jgi:hypothetical protein
VLMTRSIREQATESLMLALKERIDADAAPRSALRASVYALVSKVRPRLTSKKPVSVDAALEEVIARFPKTLDYLAK